MTCLYSQSWVSGSGRALTWPGRRHKNTAEAKMLCSYSQKNYAHKLLFKVLAGQIPHVERPRFRRLTSAHKHKHTQLHTYSHCYMQSVKALISSQQNNHSATLNAEHTHQCHSINTSHTRNDTDEQSFSLQQGSPTLLSVWNFYSTNQKFEASKNCF